MENDQIKNSRFLVIGILLLCYSTDVYSHNLLQISLRSVLEQVMKSSQYGMDINDEPTGPFLRGILWSKTKVLNDISHVPVFSSESLTPERFEECIDEWEDKTCDGEICKRK